MKTSLEISKEKLQKAMKLSGLRTIREIVDKALDELILRAKREEMAKMLGTAFFSGRRAPERVKRYGTSRR